MESNFNVAKKKILLVTAHPDDADFFAGGTIYSWLQKGASASILVCTNGNKGSHDEKLSPKELTEIRREEQLEVSKFLGLEHTWFLDFEDAHLEVTQDLKEKIVRVIRDYKPEIVFTFDPTLLYSLDWPFINHPDHRAVGQATLDAVYPMARDFLTFPDQQSEGLTTHCVSDVFLFNSEKANFYSDITTTFESKLHALSLHPSQMDMKEVKPLVEKLNRGFGKEINVDFAERFLHLKSMSPD